MKRQHDEIMSTLALYYFTFFGGLFILCLIMTIYSIAKGILSLFGIEI